MTSSSAQASRLVPHLGRCADEAAVGDEALRDRRVQRIIVTRRDRRAGGGDLVVVAGLLEVGLVVRQLEVHAQRGARRGESARAVVADGGHDEGAGEEALAPIGRDFRERGRHVRSDAVRPERAIGDLAGERRHAAAQGREHQARERSALGVHPHLRDVLTHVGERSPDAEPERLVHRLMRDAETEQQASRVELLDHRARLPHQLRMPQVDVRDARADSDALGAIEDGEQQGDVVASARRPDAGEAPPLQVLDERHEIRPHDPADPRSSDTACPSLFLLLVTHPGRGTMMRPRIVARRARPRAASGARATTRPRGRRCAAARRAPSVRGCRRRSRRSAGRCRARRRSCAA